jgi:tRNA-2-methylthio-N6-dimethylallyladenosine synthase
MSTEISELKGVYISTYGCQMNVNDTDRMYSLLEMINYAPVTSPDQADLIIINSCSVREKPVHKVHSEVGRYRGLKNEKPGLKIGVGGCVAQQEKKQLLADVPLLDFVFGTDAIDSLPSLVKDLEQGEEKKVDAKFRHSEPYHVQTLVKKPRREHLRQHHKRVRQLLHILCGAFHKRAREKPPSETLDRRHSQTDEEGVKEVTLLGQNVNSYKSDCGANFGELMRAVAVDTDIERIRFTTSHPKDF